MANRLSADTWACAAPLACAVHCLSAPLLVVVAPPLAPTPTTEWLLLGGSGAIAGWILARGIERHGRASVLAPAVTGLLLWAASLGGWFAPVPEELTTVLASLVLAGSLFLNLSWQRASAADGGCGCVACEPHETEAPSRSVARETRVSG